MDDTLASIQEEGESALKEIDLLMQANPLAAATYGLGQAAILMTNIVSELSAGLTADERAVTNEALGVVRGVLQATQEAAKAARP